MAKEVQTEGVDVSAGAFRQREMTIGHVSQGRASFASEEYGSSEGRTGWAGGGRKEALREREDSLVFS